MHFKGQPKGDQPFVGSLLHFWKLPTINNNIWRFSCPLVQCLADLGKILLPNRVPATFIMGKLVLPKGQIVLSCQEGIHLILGLPVRELSSNFMKRWHQFQLHIPYTYIYICIYIYIYYYICVYYTCRRWYDLLAVGTLFQVRCLQEKQSRHADRISKRPSKSVR